MERLAAQLDRTLQALSRLVLVLEELAARPPVHLHAERLEVQTLAFHLGDIDVEQLEGQLNIGITHSLNLQPPSPRGEAEPERPPGFHAALPAKTGHHAQAGGVRDDPPDQPGSAKPGPQQPGLAQRDPGRSGPAEEGRARRALRNSVVSRWLAQAYTPGEEQARMAGPHQERAPEAEPAPAAERAHGAEPAPAAGAEQVREPPSPPRIQIWPPPHAEGSETDGEGQPGAPR